MDDQMFLRFTVDLGSFLDWIFSGPRATSPPARK